MRIGKVSIQNFKVFGDKIEIDFSNKILDKISDEYLIVGDNGSGKTTVLQAVALVLSLAQGSIQRVDEFRWAGWNAKRYLKWGEPEIEVEIFFDPDEVAATREAASRWGELNGRADVSSRYVLVQSGAIQRKLHLKGMNLQNDPGDTGFFRGRKYAFDLLKKVNDPSILKLFDVLPSLFWYDQYRGLSDLSDGSRLEEIERKIKEWHQLGDPAFQKLDSLYRKVFPGRSFAGIEPIYNGEPTPSGTLFVLSDGKRTYGLSEMSAGEQTIFPILFEFISKKINNSIILIDELDLNLHPPLAQRILNNLSRLGRNNQFIFTTHSHAIADMVSPYTITRLPGGHLCL